MLNIYVYMTSYYLYFLVIKKFISLFLVYLLIHVSQCNSIVYFFFLDRKNTAFSRSPLLGQVFRSLTPNRQPFKPIDLEKMDSRQQNSPKASTQIGMIWSSYMNNELVILLNT